MQDRPNLGGGVGLGDGVEPRDGFELGDGVGLGDGFELGDVLVGQRQARVAQDRGDVSKES